MGKPQKRGTKERDRTSWPLDLFEFLDIPRELVLDLPRLTLIGDIQLLIENYLGLQHYDTKRVEVMTKSGLLRISGETLGLSYISPAELLIRGKIMEIVYLCEGQKR